jgi:hypothetical protein
MITLFEKITRIKEYYRFSKEELIALCLVTLATGFIFSLQFPGERFTLISWLYFFITTTIIAAITIFSRITLQKFQGLWRGYYIEFKVWWVGVVASLIIAFISFGYVPLIAFGSVASTFMVRQRLGEFRYGYSFGQNATVTSWGIITNIYLATAFAFLLYFFPESHLLKIGMIMNLVMGFCQLLPLPWLEGLQIFFGSKALYGGMWFYLLSVALLLATGTRIGLIIAILMEAIIALSVVLWGDV